MGSFLRRIGSQSTTPDGSGSSAPFAGDALAFPALVEFLASECYETGESRQTGTLTVFAEEGRWKVCLNDRDQGQVGFVTVGDLADLVLAVEEVLREGKGEWRAARGTKGKR